MGKGAGIGGMLGTAFGSIYGPMGSSVGSAGGKMMGGVIDNALAKKTDEKFGPSGTQLQSLKRADATVSKVYEQEGMGSGTVQRAQESQNRSIVQEDRVASTLAGNPQMSSLAQEQMGKALVKEIVQTNAVQQEKIMEADVRAEKEKISNIGKAEDIRSKIEAEVKKAQALEQSREDARSQALINSVSGAMGVAGKGFGMGTDDFGIAGNAMKGSTGSGETPEAEGGIPMQQVINGLSGSKQTPEAKTENPTPTPTPTATPLPIMVPETTKTESAFETYMKDRDNALDAGNSDEVKAMDDAYEDASTIVEDQFRGALSEEDRSSYDMMMSEKAEARELETERTEEQSVEDWTDELLNTSVDDIFNNDGEL